MDPRAFYEALLQAKGFNTTSLARRLREIKAVSTNIQPHLNRWVRGESQDPAMRTFRPVAEFLKVRVEAFYDPQVAAAEAERLGLNAPIDNFTFFKETKVEPGQSVAAPGKNNNEEALVERDPLLVVLEHLDPANREKLFTIAVELLKHQAPSAGAKKKGAA